MKTPSKLEGVPVCLKCYPKSSACLIVILLLFFIPNLHATLLAVPSRSPWQREKDLVIKGRIVDQSGQPVSGVSISVKQTRVSTLSDENGEFLLNYSGTSGVVSITHISYLPQDITFSSDTTLHIFLVPRQRMGEEVIVVGYGTQKRKTVTGSVASVSAEEISRVQGGSTLSTTLAGKLPGVSFRMSDGRPGSSATIQIRNMGTPLYIIDGVQQDQGQFNNLAPRDIESISVLKDASAAIYGLQSANGVVLVTTKKGRLGAPNIVNINAKLGFQSLVRFFEPIKSSYDYMRYRAEAQMNSLNPPNPKDPKAGIITLEELEKYKQGIGFLYRSFDWKKFIIKNNAPLNEVNVNFTGGSDKINYYASLTNLFQTAVFGREYRFKRTNIQSNISARVAEGLKVTMGINGRVESRYNPGVPNPDDYYQPLYAVIRNKPTQRPFANDNPNYLNNIGHNETNWGYLNEKLSGLFKEDWRVVQTNIEAEYQVPGVKGLSLRAMYAYLFADRLLNNHEYTFDAYTYFDATDTSAAYYKRTGGSSNPWRERRQDKRINSTWQGQITYSRRWSNHQVGATLVSERILTKVLQTWYRTNPTTNELTLMPFAEANAYEDQEANWARSGYALRVNYNYANKYFLEFLGRRDASYLFPPGKRVGYFPGGSVGWRITEEKFMRHGLGENSWLNDLKLRASYGRLGDDGGNNSPIVDPFAYLEGYSYYQPPYIFGGVPVIGSVDKGAPTTRLSWQTKTMLNVGLDFTLLKSRLLGTVEYFYNRTSGIPAPNSDVTMPAELGYSLPYANLNKASRRGVDMSLAFENKVGDFMYRVGSNFSFSRDKMDFVYNQKFLNSIDRYFNTGAQGRYTGMQFGYQIIGQFKTQEEINNYPVDVDGEGNRTLLPGDLIIKDLDGNGVITSLDRRPIGWGTGQPNINYGLSLGLSFKRLDFVADFSGAAGYSWVPGETLRVAFSGDNNLNSIMQDRWHRENYYDVNSPWIPGRFPAFRFNNGGHRNNILSDFWNINVRYFRARTIELGYVFPDRWSESVKISKARFYVNVYNLFSIDNVRQYNVDPEITVASARQYPQSRVFNIGLNITFK